MTFLEISPHGDSRQLTPSLCLGLRGGGGGEEEGEAGEEEGGSFLRHHRITEVMAGRPLQDQQLA